jgi:cytidylate kinase
MSSILVSSQSFTRGPEVARRVASELGYRFVGDDFYDDVAKSHDCEPSDLRKALDRPSSLFGVSDAARRTLVAHLQAALAARLLGDELVFHGPYAHALVPGVSHILRVRFVAAAASRAAAAATREDLAPRKADKRIAADDAARDAISELLFGFGDDDDRYDLVVDLEGRDDDAARDCVVNALKSNAYVPMTYSMRRMQDVELGCRVRSAIVDLDPGARVEADQGVLEIRIWTSSSHRAKLEAEVTKRASGLAGVRGVDVRVFDNALHRGRA